MKKDLAQLRAEIDAVDLELLAALKNSYGFAHG